MSFVELSQGVRSGRERFVARKVLLMKPASERIESLIKRFFRAIGKTRGDCLLEVALLLPRRYFRARFSAGFRFMVRMSLWR